MMSEIERNELAAGTMEARRARKRAAQKAEAHLRTPRGFFDAVKAEADKANQARPEMLAVPRFKNDEASAFNFLKGYVEFLDETRSESNQRFRSNIDVASHRVVVAIRAVAYRSLGEPSVPEEPGVWPVVVKAVCIEALANAAFQRR